MAFPAHVPAIVSTGESVSRPVRRQNLPVDEVQSAHAMNVYALHLVEQASRIAKIVALALIGTAFASCNGVRLDAQVSPYIGRPASILVTRLGPPNTRMVNADGQIVFQWHDVGAKTVTTAEGLTVHSSRCVLTIESAPFASRVSSSAEDWLIKSYEFSGGGCV
jgi:hypothetical protein